MKLLTVFGTRPEIIRLSLIIKQLDRFCKHIMVHTGQNYDENLSDVFFRELDLRAPDLYLGVQAATFSDQVGKIMIRMGEVLEEMRPDRVMILGDTNSGLAAVVAARRGIPVYHLEAGNRCYDDRVPEEINRRIIDHCSTVLMPYTNRSKQNLLREGFDPERVFVIGNPIYEVLNTYAPQSEAGSVLARLSLGARSYFLVTMHREENVDDPERLGSILDALERIAGRDTAARVRVERDPEIERIVLGWPAKFVTERAERLGFGADSGIEEIIRAHMRTLANQQSSLRYNSNPDS